ncbi:hypothetical protein OIU78_007189 [Salix suchowensis]|nr:hypothetical protein OIU78_007189 [Salix suchowensis]
MGLGVDVFINECKMFVIVLVPYQPSCRVSCKIFFLGCRFFGFNLSRITLPLVLPILLPSF